MPTQLTHVRPGDLITADQWNLLIDTVNALQQSGTTGPSAVAIAGTVPSGTASDPFPIGGTLQILGSNFAYGLGLTTVTFVGPSGRTELSASHLLAGSSDTRLVLTVPSIPGVTTTSTGFSLIVGNGNQSATQPYFARIRSNPLTGDLFVNWRANTAGPNPDPNPVLADSGADFAFSVQADTNQRAAVSFLASIQNASISVPGGVIASLEVRDENGASLAGRSLEFQPAQTRNLTVHFPEVPANWDQESFTIVLTATAGGLSGSGSRDITVGATTAANDPAITVNQTEVDVFNAAGNDETNPANFFFNGSTVRLRAGRTINIGYAIVVATAGTYTATFAARAGGTLTGWNPEIVNSDNPFTAAQDNDPIVHPLRIGLRADAGASATGAVVLTLRRTGATVEWTREITVELIA